MWFRCSDPNIAYSGPDDLRLVGGTTRALNPVSVLFFRLHMFTHYLSLFGFVDFWTKGPAKSEPGNADTMLGVSSKVGNYAIF